MIHGGKLNFNYFFNHSLACNFGLLPKLKYDGIIDTYLKLFGENSVYVFLYEDLRNGFDEEIKKIMNLLGIRSDIEFNNTTVNRSLSNSATFLVRQMNKIWALDFNEQYYNWINSNLRNREKLRWRIIRILKRIEALKPMSKDRKETSMLSATQKARIREYYHSSNARLSKMLNRPLNELNYY